MQSAIRHVTSSFNFVDKGSGIQKSRTEHAEHVGSDDSVVTYEHAESIDSVPAKVVRFESDLEEIVQEKKKKQELVSKLRGIVPTMPRPEQREPQQQVEYESQPINFVETHLKQNTKTETNGAHFQMMDVTVTVLGLTGVLKEKIEPRQSKACMFGTNGCSINKNNKDFPVKFITTTCPPGTHINDIQNSTASLSTYSNCSSNSVEEFPIFGLASFTRNALNSNTTITTHLPSFPLTKPVRKYDGNNIFRYTSTWPANNIDVSLEDIDRSSVSFSRVFQREKYHQPRDGTRNLNGYSNSILKDNGSVGSIDDTIPCFLPELVKMRVGLFCAGEMITLGYTTIVISGEVNSIEFNLPLHTNFPTQQHVTSLSPHHTPGSRDAKGRRVTKGLGKLSFPRNKEIQACSFAHDPSVKYRIDENATLRVMLTVVPHNTANVEQMTFESLRINSIPNDNVCSWLCW